MLSRCARQLSRRAWAPVGSWPTCSLLPAAPWPRAAPRRSHSVGSSRQAAVKSANTSQTAWPTDVEAHEQGAEMHVHAVPSVQDLEARIGQLSTRPTVSGLQPLVIVISGPSGVGKDAVIKQLKEECPDLHFVVTATTRLLREGEVDGVDYLFVSNAQFEQWVEEDELLEHALVYGDYKGIPRHQVHAALGRGTDVVLRVDVQGAATVRRLIPDSVSIFLVADSERELVHRLISRKTEPMESMLVRVSTARQETAAIQHFDYVVVNRENQLSSTVDEIRAIMLAEKLKVQRRLLQ